MLARLGRQLARVGEQVDPAVGVDDGEAQRQRRVGHVAAAQVEQPGERRRVGQHRRAGAGARDRLGHLGALVGAESPGEGLVMGDDGRQRRRWLVGPHGVQRVRRRGRQAPPRLGRRLGQAVHLGLGVQPGIVAERPAAAQARPDPSLGWVVGQVMALERGAVHLRLGLQGVAAVHKDRRRVRQHHGDAGRAGEPGQPRQAPRARREVFALVLVGDRHQEAVETAPRQLGAQRVQARGRRVVVGPRRFGHHILERQQLIAQGSRRLGHHQPGPCRGVVAFGGGQHAGHQRAHVRHRDARVLGAQQARQSRVAAIPAGHDPASPLIGTRPTRPRGGCRRAARSRARWPGRRSAASRPGGRAARRRSGAS